MLKLIFISFLTMFSFTSSVEKSTHTTSTNDSTYITTITTDTDFSSAKGYIKRRNCTPSGCFFKNTHDSKAIKFQALYQGILSRGTSGVKKNVVLDPGEKIFISYYFTSYGRVKCKAIGFKILNERFE